MGRRYHHQDYDFGKYKNPENGFGITKVILLYKNDALIYMVNGIGLYNQVN